MSDDRDDYWDMRLHNWALYYLGGVSLAGRSSLCFLVICGPCIWDETREVALVGEAVDTDNLVQKLKPEQIKTVRAYYAWSGTKEWIASQLGIALRTLFWRVQDAKDELDRLQSEVRLSMPKINNVKCVDAVA